MTRYMLDTNTVSKLIKGHPLVAERLLAVPMASLCISAVTKGELMFGLARRPEAARLHALVREFLQRVDVLPWDGAVADDYGLLRAQLAAQGKSLGALDMLMAANALGTNAILVTSDRTFSLVARLKVEDWAA
jgi:tRNA(fMet)-specific endonuclease VapC